MSMIINIRYYNKEFKVVFSAINNLSYFFYKLYIIKINTITLIFL